MERIFQYTITESDNLRPIGLFLKSMGYSSQNLISLKKLDEGILLNDTPVYINEKLHTHDVLTIHIKELESSPRIRPVPLPLDILYEDSDLVIVNKPSNMPIHPSQNNHDNTLANAIMHYYNEQEIPYVFRCINRLDRDTSGLTILAKHMLSGNLLSTMVQNREIKREYLAIAKGIPVPDIGVINAPIARTVDSTIERCVACHGEAAVTHYKVLETNHGRGICLLSLWLETGRTHQIRVHLKHIGHPLLGDFLYNPDMRYIHRQALHSHRLTFTHPITRELMTFTAPLPDDMKEALEATH
ncbi:MAG: RluA family pseudouridine synthase [Lachnospiraceae bacterium]|nr:RluA family pseudouridine synthase [Lachnospiraceae bacterium]